MSIGLVIFFIFLDVLGECGDVMMGDICLMIDGFILELVSGIWGDLGGCF